MPLVTGEGFGASGWEQDNDRDMLGMVFGTVEGILSNTARGAREQPMLAAAVAAALAGAIVGSVLAAKTGRQSPLRVFSRKTQRNVGRASGLDLDLGTAWSIPALLPPLMRLLSNPLVQAYLRRAITNMVSNRLSGRA